jgi:hypothetical protein
MAWADSSPDQLITSWREAALPVTASRRSYLDSPRLSYPAVELIILQDVFYDSGAMTSKEGSGLLLALVSVDVLFGRMLNLSILR